MGVFMESVTSSYTDGINALGIIDNIKKNGRSYVNFSCFSPCYKFSNENLCGYYPKFNIDGGSVLTVCGSGDQVLSAVLYGAKKVDCFDSNRLSYYNMMLKVYAVKYLEYEDFLCFFGIADSDFDPKKIYNMFKNNISDKSIRIFFDLLFEKCPDISWMYISDSDYDGNLLNNIPYLVYDNYYKLKDLLNSCEITFKESDLFNVFDKFQNKYNFINFSNIYDYVQNYMSFCNFVIDAKRNYLTDDGSIMINYSWSKPYHRESINMTADIIGAYQTAVKSYDCNVNSQSNSIMYCKKI